MSAVSRESPGNCATRRSAASARARRLAQRAPVRKAVISRAATCGFFRIKGRHDLGEEIVAGTVSAVELGRIRLHESADQRAHAFGFDMSNAGWASRPRTRVSVPASGIIAWMVNHLSITKRMLLKRR